MAQTIGVVKIWWRGKKYDVQKGVRWRLPGMQNEDQDATDRTLRSMRWNHGMAQATVMITSSSDEDDFDPALGEGELQIQTDIGAVYVFPDAYTRAKPDVQDNGQAPVNWTLNTYQKISA
ncbi:phage tail tube protein [Gluconobacter sp.]|uniref:phage tail tube protein n=1 Tax=Gluconobacter sp. TaxID=1876758 RepID=UPI0039EA591C